MTQSPLSSASAEAQRQRTWISTIPLVAGGSMLEFYEFQTYALFTTIIANSFFSPSQPEWIRQLQAFSLLSVAFLFRPIAGALIGMLGDRVGRKSRSFSRSC